MKRLLLLPILLIGSIAFGQIVDQFNYTGALNANGWTTHSGATPGQIQADNAGSLTYSSLPTSLGNKALCVSGNTEDINKPVTGMTSVGYYSLLVNLPNTTGLALNTATNGDHFFGFATTAGATGVTTFFAQLRIRQGTVAGTFQLGIVNQGAGTLAASFTGDLNINQTYMIAVKFDRTTAPTSASLWVNPTLGLATEPAPTVSSTIGTGTIATYGSLYIRQGTNTGNVQLDEIRSGTTWTQVTPNSCATSSNLTVTNCGPYTLNGTTYSTSGNYQQVLANANSVGCDSTINLTLTVKNPTTNNMTVSNCGPYTLNGQTYTTSGTYVQTLTNVAGCDSTINLNLSIVASLTYYADADNDGLGNPAVSQLGCASIPGYVTNANDCDDNNALVGAATTWYADADNDGFGSASGMTTVSCTQPIGYVANNTDCNDANAAVHPGATEIANNGIDEDCSGADLVILPSALGTYEFTANDCAAPVWNVTTQPTNATFSLYGISGGQTCAQAANVINYNTWNQTGAINPNEYYSFTLTPASCYALNLYTLKFSQRASSGAPTVTVRSSLDNFTADVYTGTVPNTITPVTVTLPAAYNNVYSAIEFRFYITGMGSAGATYRHDNVSLEGFITALTTQTYYADVDADGYGDAATSITNCVPPAGYVTDNTDCNDNNANEYPGAEWFQDLDNDGFGNDGVFVTSCTQPMGYVVAGGDCNDNNAAITGPSTYYQDVDNDGFGNLAMPMTACTQPVGYVTNANDCDDNDALSGVATTYYYADADMDGFGSMTDSILACAVTPGYVSNNNDCDDNNPSVNPSATEVCDGVDNNCDGNIDEGLTAFTWYEDADSDGLGNPASTTQDCSQPVGYVGNQNDCDDTDPTPNAGETVYYADVDGDGFGDINDPISTCNQPAGYVANDTDCDDTNANINPNATDVNGNGIDENCDGVDGYLGLNDLNQMVVSVAPNPGVNEFQVITAFTQNTTVEVLTVDGKVVAAATSSNGTVTVETSELSRGTYIVRVSSNGQVATTRWMKQ